MSVNLENLRGNIPFVQYLSRLEEKTLRIPNKPSKTYIAAETPQAALEKLQLIHAEGVIVMTSKGRSRYPATNFQGKKVYPDPDCIKYLIDHGVDVTACHYVRTLAQNEFSYAAANCSRLGIHKVIWDFEIEADQIPNAHTAATNAIKSVHSTHPDLQMGITTWALFFRNFDDMNNPKKSIHNLKLAQSLWNMDEIRLGIPMVCPKNDRVNKNVVDMFSPLLNLSLSQWSVLFPDKPWLIWYPAYTGEGTKVMGRDILPMVGLIAEALPKYCQINGVSPWSSDHAFHHNASFGCATALQQVDYSVFRGNN